MVVLTVIIGIILAGTLIQALLCCFERNKLKNNTYGQVVLIRSDSIGVNNNRYLMKKCCFLRYLF